MKAFVHVEDDWMRDKVAVHLAEGGEEFVHIYDFAAVTVTRAERTLAHRETTEPLRLTHDMARALYEGLAKHFGGAPETATLRKDYEAERARVDVFITHLTRATS